MFKFNREKILPVFFKKRWTMREFAKRAGVTQPTAKKAVWGLPIQPCVIGKIAAALEINALDYLEDKLKDS